MASLTIYNVHHQEPSWYLHDEIFKPFIVGGETRGEFLCDDWGENIRDRHSFGEMRCHYHVWRNRLNSPEENEFIGFQHYRRQFLWNAAMSHAVLACDQRVYQELAFSSRVLKARDFTFDIVAARRLPALPTIGHHYALCHSGADWNVFFECLSDVEKEIVQVLTWINPCNMFVMPATLFAQYMRDWWRVMSLVTQKVTPAGDGYQPRTFGFMSERYFTIWLERMRQESRGLRILEFPTVFGQFSAI